jgi:hypothetical protein
MINNQLPFGLVGSAIRDWERINDGMEAIFEGGLLPQAFPVS